jgi:multiple antibiotic resistance protein
LKIPLQKQDDAAHAGLAGHNCLRNIQQRSAIIMAVMITLFGRFLFLGVLFRLNGTGTLYTFHTFTMSDITHIFTILFLMLGPFKVIGPYTKITAGADPVLARRVAIRAVLISVLALLLAGLLGENILSNYGIPVPILAMAGGLILFLVAIRNVIQQFEEHGDQNAAQEPLTMKKAMYPLAFPTIVTPYGIAAVIVFISIIPDAKGDLMVGAIVLGIMVLNLVMMLTTRYTFKYLAIILPVLGAILSVIQVALGMLVMYNAFKELQKLG